MCMCVHVRACMPLCASVSVSALLLLSLNSFFFHIILPFVVFFAFFPLFKDFYEVFR